MSEVRVNKLSPRSGTTVTLGDSGDTISIPSGVTLSNAGTNTFASATITGDLTVDTDTLFVDASENTVVIGGTDASSWNTNADELVVAGASAGGMTFYNPTQSNIFFADGTTGDDVSRGRIQYVHSGDSLIFGTDATERMRIDSSGNVGIGTTSPSPYNLYVKDNSGTSTIRAESSDNYRIDMQANSGNGTIRTLGSYPLILNTNQIERMRITSSGNVGIGTTSPANKLHVLNASSGATYTADGADLFIIENNDSLRIDLKTTSANTAGIMFSTSVRNVGALQYSHSTDSMSFRTNSATRMTIGSSGYVGIGTSSPAHAIELWGDGGNTIFAIRDTDTSPTFSNRFIKFQNLSGTEIGSIQRQGSAVAYVTSSDYRLKENVSYDFDATTRLKQLRPARFNFIGETDRTVDGFLAHEVSDIVPEAISGEKDETETKEKVVVNANGQVIAENIEQADWEAGKIADENGNTQYPTDSTWEATKVIPVYQGIDQSKLVPLLVKTIQELEARITALENA